MFCAISKEQISDFRARLYGLLFKKADDKQPIKNLTDFMRSVRDNLIEASKDEEGNPDIVWANTHVAFIPNALLQAYGNRKLRSVLPASTNELIALDDKFSDPVNGYDAIVNELKPKKASTKNLNASLQATALQSKKEDKDDIKQLAELRSEVYNYDTAKPVTALSTTGQESTLNEKGEYTNIVNPEEEFYRGLRNKIVKALKNSGMLTGETLTYGGHTGFRLAAMMMNQIPGVKDKDYTQLRPSTSDLLINGGKVYDSKEKREVDITADEYYTKYFKDGQTLVLTDNEGNILYFDENGNVVPEGEGRIFYTSLRRVLKNNDGSFWSLNVASISEIVNKKALEIAQLTKNYVKRNPNESDISYHKRLIKAYNLEDYVEKVKELRQQELKQIKDIRDYITANPTGRVLLDITNGSYGYYKPARTPLSKFEIGPNDIIHGATETTATEIEGYPYLYMDTIGVPIELRGKKVVESDSSILQNFAQVLARDLYINNEKQSNLAKVNYILQFIYPDTKKNNIFLRHVLSTDSIELRIGNSKLYEFPDKSKMSETERAEAEAELENNILKALKAPEVANNLYFIVKNSLVGSNVELLNINGNIATLTKSSYINFLKSRVDAFAEPASDGKVYALNGYFNFSLPQDQADLVQNKTEETQETKAVEDKETTEKINKAVENSTNVVDVTSKGVDDDDIGELARSRMLRAGATQEQIIEAIRWWNNSPLKGLIPLTRMINIVNSDAWATFTKSGITLYEGSDFTDVYHEAWHAFSQLFLTKEQKEKLYKEVAAMNIMINLPDGSKIKSADATPRQIEEHLAEEFRAFAMNKGVFPSAKKATPKVRKNIFSKIWDFLKNWLGGGVTAVEETAAQEYIGPEAKYFKELYFGGADQTSATAFKNNYMPHADITKYYGNIMFGYLANSPTSLDENATESITFDEAIFVTSNVDSLLSMWVDAQNLSRQDRLATARLFSVAANQKTAYAWIKKQFESKIKELSNTYDSLSEERKLDYKNQILANDIRVLKWAVDNWGEPGAVISGKQERGMLSFVRSRSRFKDVMKKVTPDSVKDMIEESTELPSNDSEKITKGLRFNDRTGTELSLKEMANNSTLYLIRSLHKINAETGEVELNRIGYPELIQFNEAWNALVRNLAGSATPTDIYQKMGDANLFVKKDALKSERNEKIKAAKENPNATDEDIEKIRSDYNKKINAIDRQLASKSSFPSFIQLADKLGPPSPLVGKQSSQEFDMWTEFWQDMCKPRIPLVQMTNNKYEHIDEDTGEIIEEATYTYSIGRTTTDLSRIQFDWLSEFKKQNPETNPFVKQDQNRENILNLEAIMQNFAILNKNKTGYTLAPDKKIEFLRAVGIYMDDKLEIRSIIDSDSSLEISRIFKAVENLYNSKAIVYNPVRVLRDGFTYDYEITKPNGSVQRVTRSEPAQKTRLEKLAAIQSRLSDSYSNLSTTTAENKKAYEHSLNNALTILVEGINRSTSFQSLYDENGETPWLSHYNPLYNPMVLSSQIFNSIYVLDVDVTDPLYGSKRVISKKETIEYASLLLENISGVQMTKEGMFFEKGISSAASDRVSKFISDFHMLLDSGHIEFPRHGSKTASFGMRAKRYFTHGRKVENHLYIDTMTFLESARGGYSIANNTDVMNIMLGYLRGEILRAGIIRNNKEVYSNISGYKNGEGLTAFDDIIEPAEKNILLSEDFYDKLLSNGNDIQGLLNQPENVALRFKITQQIGKYFDKLSGKTNDEMIKAEFISPQLVEKIINTYVKDPDLAKDYLNNKDYLMSLRNAMIRSYTVNYWIHTMESSIVIYGDLVQFNHDKDEFNKRNSSWASTGYLFRTDKSAIDFINTIWRRPLLQRYSELNPGKVSEDILNRQYDGTMNTAILKEPIYRSYLYEYYDKRNRDYYTKLLTKQKTPKSKIKGMVDQILYGEGGTFNEPTGGIMEPYFKMKVADGQGYVTFDSYRTLRKLEGKWLDIHEKNYMRIINGETLTPEEISIFYPPYKCIHAGFLKSKTLPVSSVHKFSLLPLIPGVIKDANIEKLHNKMMEQGIDYVLFESGSKVNHIGNGDQVYSDAKTKTFNDELTFTKNVIYLNYLKNQLDINMEFKGSTIFSTQLRKLAIQGLYENGEPVSKEAGLKAKAYIDLIDKITEEKRKEFLEEAGIQEDKDGNIIEGDISNLVSLVQDQLRNLGMSDHEIQFIDFDKETGEVKYDWSAHLSRERLERLVVALVNNRLIKQKMNGEPLVQASNSLFEKPSKFRNATQEELEKNGYDNLPTYSEGKNGKTTAAKIKIAMREEFMSLFKLKDNNGKTIAVYDKVLNKAGDLEYTLNMRKSLDNLNELLKNEEWLDKDDNRKKVTMVGVRIPVQGLGQMEFMEVYEFLDPSAGNIIILPYEIVAKSGADFDIDKLNIFMPRLTSEGNVLTTKYKSIEEISKAIEDVKKEKSEFLKSINAEQKLSEIEKNLKGTLKDQRKALRSLGSQIAIAKEEKRQIILDIRTALSKSPITKKLDKEAIEIIAKGTDQELMDLFNELRKSKKIYKLGKDIQNLNTDSYDNYVKLKQLRDAYKLSEEEFDELEAGVEKSKAFNAKLSELYDQKRNYVSIFENKLIDSISDILSMPDNFIHLIRPNSTDLVKGVSDELKPFVQENDHRVSMLDGSVRKKGISPTRVLEPIFNLDKHQSNNIGKKSLGIAAQVNTANTISTFIGGYIPAEFTYSRRIPKTDDFEEVKVPVTLALNHNTMIKNGKKVISLAGLYDANGYIRISDIISQLMNGFVDVEKDDWVAYIQGNIEVTPVLLMLVEAGVPFREAAYFVSNPLVREYVKQQRLIKTTFSGPLGTEVDNINFYRNEAYQRVLTKYNLGKALTNLSFHEDVNKKLDAIKVDGKIPMSTLERIAATDKHTVNINGVKAKGLPVTSAETEAAFKHFIQIERFTSGIRNLRFKTSVDTKKDATLADAKLREIEIDDLYYNQGVPRELIDAYMEESVISSFFIQGFQQKLWGRFFGTTNNEAVQEFLVRKLRDREAIDKAKELTGYDVSQLAAEFKNDFMVFLFQNYVKSFDLRRSDYYNGIKTEEKVPVKYVDLLKSGVVVKETNGKPVIYIDIKQVESDWNNKIYLKDVYTQQGLAKLPAGIFSLKGNESKKEYINFILERERLRYEITTDEAKNDPQYKNIIQNLRKSLIKSDDEKVADFNNRLSDRAYEEFLRDKALDNTLNFYKMFYHKTESMGQQILDIIKKHDHLEVQYPVLKQLSIRIGGKGVQGLEGLTNILLRDQRDIDNEVANSYHTSLKNLANPDVIKVADKDENRRISSLFKALPIFAFIQTGMSKSEYSLGNVVPYEDYMEIMQEPMRAMKEWLKPKVYKKDSKELENILKNAERYTIKADKDTVTVYNTAVLDRFWTAFVNQNSKANIALRRRYKMYLYDATPAALVDGSNLFNSVIDSKYVEQSNRPGVFRLVTSRGMIPYAGISALANANTDANFLYEDVDMIRQYEEAGEDKEKKILISNIAKKDTTIAFSNHPNASGIRTKWDTGRPFNPTTEEELNEIKQMIKDDIDAAVQNGLNKSIVYPDKGIGQELLTSTTVKLTTQPSTKELTVEEADWMYNNDKKIFQKYNTSTLANSVDPTLKKPLVFGETIVTAIDPVVGYDSFILFERPSGKWKILISEKNGKPKVSLKQLNEKGTYYSLRISEETEKEIIAKSGLTNLIKSIYKDTNIKQPATRRDQFEAQNSLQQKYGLKRTYKDIVNELYNQSGKKTTAVDVENNEYRQEIFRYLSELLYTNFGIVNPGSQDIPSVMDIIAKEQGVTDQDKEDLKNRCLTL